MLIRGLTLLDANPSGHISTVTDDAAPTPPPSAPEISDKAVGITSTQTSLTMDIYKFINILATLDTGHRPLSRFFRFIQPRIHEVMEYTLITQLAAIIGGVWGSDNLTRLITEKTEERNKGDDLSKEADARRMLPHLTELCLAILPLTTASAQAAASIEEEIDKTGFESVKLLLQMQEREIYDLVGRLFMQDQAGGLEAIIGEDVHREVMKVVQRIVMMSAPDVLESALKVSD